jgi:hypothetical protein
VKSALQAKPPDFTWITDRPLMIFKRHKSGKTQVFKYIARIKIWDFRNF